uniref:Uncharacterized protein n=1 Tax=Arundo donax TaxID=35708 RepID=A0A0A9E7W5_ARUDO
MIIKMQLPPRTGRRGGERAGMSPTASEMATRRREREDEYCLEDDEEVARGGAECCLGDGEAAAKRNPSRVEMREER